MASGFVMQISISTSLLQKGKKADIPPLYSPVEKPPTAKKSEGKAIKML